MSGLRNALEKPWRRGTSPPFRYSIFLYVFSFIAAPIIAIISLDLLSDIHDAGYLPVWLVGPIEFLYQWPFLILWGILGMGILVSVARSVNDRWRKDR